METPCNWKHFLSNAVPPCEGRDDNASRQLVDSGYCPHGAQTTARTASPRPAESELEASREGHLHNLELNLDLELHLEAGGGREGAGGARSAGRHRFNQTARDARSPWPWPWLPPPLLLPSARARFAEFFRGLQ